MCKNKNDMMAIIEFYLSNLQLINRELEYRRQLGKTASAVLIKRLYKPVPFSELESIAKRINRSIQEMDNEKKEYIRLRYQNKCTYDVICGFMCKKRSTVFTVGTEIIEKLLFDILVDSASREAIMSCDRKCYILKSENE